MIGASGRNVQQAFKNEIRRRQIDKMRKSKRQIINQEQLSSLSNNSVYQETLENPQYVFQQKEKYLLYLREALNSQVITAYHAQLPNILQTLIRFYYEEDYQQFSCNQLFMECIACIFFQTQFYGQIVQQAVTIVLKQLNLSKNESENSLQNRCLVALQNITFAENYEICRIGMEAGLMEELLCLVEDYPVVNEQKQGILSIYGNMLEYLVMSGSEYYIEIVEKCITENYDKQIIAKCLEILKCLSSYQQAKFSAISSVLQTFFFILNSSNIYFESSQDLCLKIITKMSTQEQQTDQIQRIHEKIHNQLIFICYQFNAQYNLNTLLVAIIEQMNYYEQYLEEGVSGTKNYELTQALLDNWIQMEEQCSEYQQLEFLRVLNIATYNTVTLFQIRKQHEGDEHNRKNSSNFSILDSVLEFLKNVTLNSAQKRRVFLSIMNNQKLLQLATPDYREIYLQKVQELAYDSVQDLSQKAKYALNLLEELHQNY